MPIRDDSLLRGDRTLESAALGVIGRCGFGRVRQLCARVVQRDFRGRELCVARSDHAIAFGDQRFEALLETIVSAPASRPPAGIG